MQRSERMQSLVKLALNEENDAAKELAEAISNVEKQQSGLQELLDYRDDYTKKFHATTNTNALGMQQFSSFVAQLNQGIEHQKLVMIQVSQLVDEKRQKWIELHNRTRALDKVVEKYAKQEDMTKEKLEQKMLDECAMRKVKKF